MKAGIEKIFRTYANLSLEGKPENLLKVFDVAEEFFELFAKEYIRKVVEYMVVIEKYDIRENEDEFFRAKRELEDKIGLGDPSIKYSDLSTMVGMPIESVCHSYPCCTIPCERIWQEFNLNNPKCYLCSQILFKHFLSNIVNGVEYSDLMDDSFIADGIEFSDFGSSFSTHLFYNAYNSLRREINIVKAENDLIFKDNLEQKWTWEIDIRKGVSLNKEIVSIVGISLFEFLLDDDRNRRKLKQCPGCEEFYIQSKLNPRQKYCPDCSKKSRMTTEQRKIYDRTRKKKIKKEKEALKREEYIDRLIEAGYTKKDAEKEYEVIQKGNIEMSTE